MGHTWGQGRHAHRAVPFPRNSSNKATMSGSMTAVPTSPVPALSAAMTPRRCLQEWDCSGCPWGPLARLHPGRERVRGGATLGDSNPKLRGEGQPRPHPATAHLKAGLDAWDMAEPARERG